MNEGMDELYKWLEENAEHLKTYTLQEIADVAEASGFRKSDIAMWLTKERYKGAA